MKKLLITTSALVAATAFAGAAQAADPIKLSVGGFGSFAVGMASQDAAFSATTGVGASDYQSWDVKGNNEVFFSGKTTLDNGLTVSAKYEWEAGGKPQVASDPSDEWNITIGSSFGNFIFGAEDAATVLIAKGHKDVSGVMNGFDEGDALVGSWIVKPATIGGNSNTPGLGANPVAVVASATYINTAGDAEKVTYVSPSFAGFTFGATAVPAIDSGSGDVSAMPSGTLIEDVYGAGAMWNGDFSGASIGVEAAYVTASPASNSGAEDWAEWQTGASVSMAGFTLGGAYRSVNADLTASTSAGLTGTPGDLEGSSWEIGVAYETGPYGVSLGYFKSNFDDYVTTNNAVAGTLAEDEVSMWQLSGSYSMGPGVDMKLSGGVVDYDDGNSTALGQDNSGTYMMTGMTLAF